MLKNQGIVDFKYKDEDAKTIDQRDPLTEKWRYICSGVLFCLALPVIYQRSLSSLRYISFIIVGVITYTVILTFVQFPEYYSSFHNKPGNHIELYSKPFELRWFQGWATIMLSFYSQILFFYVRGEMMSKTEKRIGKLINLLTSFLSFFFCVFSCVGYISMGDKFIPDLFTLRREKGRIVLPADGGSGDWLMKTAQVLFTLAAFLKISIVLYPAREQIYIFYKFERSTKVHFSITFVMAAITFGVPCVYPDVTNLLGLIGGIMTGSLGYSIPLLLKLVSLKENKLSASFGFHLVLFIGVIVIQCFSTYVSVVS